MTRFIHDRFAKEYLEELLSPIGTVNIGRDVTSEVREPEQGIIERCKISNFQNKDGNYTFK